MENVGKEGEGGSVFALGTKTPTIVDVYVTLVAHYSPRPRYFGFFLNPVLPFWRILFSKRGLYAGSVGCSHIVRAYSRFQIRPWSIRFFGKYLGKRILGMYGRGWKWKATEMRGEK